MLEKILKNICVNDRKYRKCVNDQFNAPSAYLKTKAFGWVLVRTGHLIKPGRLSKIKQIKTARGVRQINFSRKSRNSSQNSFKN